MDFIDLIDSDSQSIVTDSQSKVGVSNATVGEYTMTTNDSNTQQSATIICQSCDSQ